MKNIWYKIFIGLTGVMLLGTILIILRLESSGVPSFLYSVYVVLLIQLMVYNFISSDRQKFNSISERIKYNLYIILKTLKLLKNNPIIILAIIAVIVLCFIINLIYNNYYGIKGDFNILFNIEKQTLLFPLISTLAGFILSSLSQTKYNFLDGLKNINFQRFFFILIISSFWGYFRPTMYILAIITQIIPLMKVDLNFVKELILLHSLPKSIVKNISSIKLLPLKYLVSRPNIMQKIYTDFEAINTQRSSEFSEVISLKKPYYNNIFRSNSIELYSIVITTPSNYFRNPRVLICLKNENLYFRLPIAHNKWKIFTTSEFTKKLLEGLSSNKAKTHNIKKIDWIEPKLEKNRIASIKLLEFNPVNSVRLSCSTSDNNAGTVKNGMIGLPPMDISYDVSSNCQAIFSSTVRDFVRNLDTPVLISEKVSSCRAMSREVTRLPALVQWGDNSYESSSNYYPNSYQEDYSNSLIPQEGRYIEGYNDYSYNSNILQPTGWINRNTTAMNDINLNDFNRWSAGNNIVNTVNGSNNHQIVSPYFIDEQSIYNAISSIPRLDENIVPGPFVNHMTSIMINLKNLVNNRVITNDISNLDFNGWKEIIDYCSLNDIKREDIRGGSLNPQYALSLEMKGLVTMLCMNVFRGYELEFMTVVDWLYEKIGRNIYSGFDSEVVLNIFKEIASQYLEMEQITQEEKDNLKLKKMSLILNYGYKYHPSRDINGGDINRLEFERWCIAKYPKFGWRYNTVYELAQKEQPSIIAIPNAEISPLNVFEVLKNTGIQKLPNIGFLATSLRSRGTSTRAEHFFLESLYVYDSNNQIGNGWITDTPEKGSNQPLAKKLAIIFASLYTSGVKRDIYVNCLNSTEGLVRYIADCPFSSMKGRVEHGRLTISKKLIHNLYHAD